MNVDKLKRLLSSIINTGVLTRKEDKTINDYMGIGFSHPTARNSLVSVHADSKGHRIEEFKRKHQQRQQKHQRHQRKRRCFKMAKEGRITFKKFRTQFATEEDCRKYLFEERFPNGFECPK